MDDKYDSDLFLNLQRLSIEEPELVEFFIDDDGEPQTTTISMQFKETELITKEDVDVGY